MQAIGGKPNPIPNGSFRQPLAMTSMRRSSCREGTTLRSRTKTCVTTVAPASLHTRAAARSMGPPRERNTRERGQASRWSPHASCHLAAVRSQAGPYSARVLSARPTSPTHFTRAALRRVALAWRNPPASCGACVQGATVATHVLVRDLNVVPSRQDERRIEVTANGLPLWAACNSPSTKPWCRP